MKTKVLVLLLFGMVFAFGGIAHAAAVDVVQWNTPYFLDEDAHKYNDPYYRWYNGDWGWTHNGISGSATSATLNISAWDVDAASGEVDLIYAYDNGVKTLLGSLAGADDKWAHTTFTLSSNFFDDIAAGSSGMDGHR